MPSETLQIQRVSANLPELPLPSYATPGSAGMDLAADIVEDLSILPGGKAIVPTGFAFAIPQGFEIQIRPRSGLAAKHGITVLNSPGTIDSDYRGEVKIILINLGSSTFVVHRGDRIAQAIVAPVSKLLVKEVETLEDTTRGPGGFGSTGR